MKTITSRGRKLKSIGKNFLEIDEYEYTSKNLSIFVDHGQDGYYAHFESTPDSSTNIEVFAEAQTLTAVLNRLDKKVESVQKKINRL